MGEVFEEYSEKNHEELPPLTIIQGGGTIRRDESERSLQYDKSSLSNYKMVNKDDFIVHLRSFEGGLEKANSQGIISPAYHTFHGENVDSRFYYAYFRSKNFINKDLKPHVYGIRDGRSIDIEGMKTIKIPYTAYAEQKSIGDFLTALDNLITLHQRKYDKLQVLKKAMLEKMFPKNGSSVPEIRFEGFTDAWEQRKAKDLCSISTGKSNTQDRVDDGIYPFYVRSPIVEHSNRYLFDEEAVLTVGDGVGTGKVFHYVNGKYDLHQRVYRMFDFSEEITAKYFYYYFSNHFYDRVMSMTAKTSVDSVRYEMIADMDIALPKVKEQMAISAYFDRLDHLITLHQRKPYSHIQRRCNMLNEAQRTDKFCEYYAKWITVYKKGAIRQVTMDKYLMTQKWLEKLIPDLKICDLNRIAYQQLLNDYAEYHERQTTMDFHHQLKGAVLDAVDEGLIDRDPTRKAIIKGKAPSAKKIKYLNQFELHTLLASLELKDEVNWDYFILLVAKTGMRFSEALALTPKDFDFYHQTLSISKTWDYKGAGGFQPTKNKSSVRKIQIDWQSVIRFSELVKGLPDDQPIFVDGKVYNSTVNDVLSRHCERCNIPVISIHGLRHTHASLLLFTGVSIASVARRLGHSSMTTTQKTYLHIIQELENKDIDLVMRSLSGLN